MAYKLSKGSNSSTFNNVSIDISVIGMQGKATETQKKKQKNCNIDNKNKTKNTLSNHIWKKSSMLIRLKCIWHLIANPIQDLR